jgi:hypothetical protein
MGCFVFFFPSWVSLANWTLKKTLFFQRYVAETNTTWSWNLRLKKGLMWRHSPKVQNRRKPVKEKNILYGIIKAKVKEGIPIILSTAPTQKHTHTHTHTHKVVLLLPGCSTPCQKENSQWLVKTLSLPFSLTSWNLEMIAFVDVTNGLNYVFLGCKWWQVCWLCVKGIIFFQTIFSLFMNEYVWNVNAIVVFGPSSHIIKP